MKVIEFVDRMARKLHNNHYYLKEREEEEVKLQVLSEKVSKTVLCVRVCIMACVLHPL